MYYHPDLRIAYLAPPRTASRSVVAMLAEHGFVKTETGGRHDVILEPVPGWTCTDFPAEWERVIVTVRNHWDTLVSWWGYHTTAEAFRDTWGHYTFSEWLAEFWKRPQETGVGLFAAPPRMWSQWLDHSCCSLHVVRFETLEADLRRVLPFEFGELPHIRHDWGRRGRHYREFYQDVHAAERARQLKASIAHRVSVEYAEEIAELGYGY